MRPGRRGRARVARPIPSGRGVRLFALVLLAAGLLAACGASSTAAPTAAAPTSSSAAASVPVSPLVGVVTKVDSAGLDKVTGFTLRTDAGQTLVLTIGVLENGDVFPPGHLAEHLATAAPVKVWFREDGGRLVVYRIEDAG